MAPDWLPQWTRRHRDETWGLVAVQTASYDNAERWDEFKARICNIMEIPFERDIDIGSASAVIADASAAKAKLELRWIEDPVLDGQTDADILRDRYSQIRPSLPSGQSQDVFLVASKDAIASVLDDANDQKTDEADLDGRVLATGDDGDDLEDLWWSMAPSPRRLRKRRRVG